MVQVPQSIFIKNEASVQAKPATLLKKLTDKFAIQAADGNGVEQVSRHVRCLFE